MYESFWTPNRFHTVFDKILKMFSQYGPLPTAPAYPMMGPLIYDYPNHDPYAYQSAAQLPLYPPSHMEYMTAYVPTMQPVLTPVQVPVRNFNYGYSYGPSRVPVRHIHPISPLPPFHTWDPLYDLHGPRQSTVLPTSQPSTINGPSTQPNQNYSTTFQKEVHHHPVQQSYVHVTHVHPARNTPFRFPQEARQYPQTKYSSYSDPYLHRVNRPTDSQQPPANVKFESFAPRRLMEGIHQQLPLFVDESHRVDESQLMRAAPRTIIRKFNSLQRPHDRPNTVILLHDSERELSPATKKLHYYLVVNDPDKGWVKKHFKVDNKSLVEVPDSELGISPATTSSNHVPQELRYYLVVFDPITGWQRKEFKVIGNQMTEVPHHEHIGGTTLDFKKEQNLTENQQHTDHKEQEPNLYPTKFDETSTKYFLATFDPEHGWQRREFRIEGDHLVEVRDESVSDQNEGMGEEGLTATSSAPRSSSQESTNSVSNHIAI